MHFNAKKVFLVVFFVLLLVGIPASVYLVQQQQIIEQQAEKATIISFDPVSSLANPIIKKVGDDIVLEVMVDPGGKNIVSSINVDIQYDAEKLATVSASAFVVNSEIFSSVFVGPVYTPGKISANIGISDPTKALTVTTKAVTITFKAIKKTDAGSPTQVTYTADSRATSRGPNDQALENVLFNTLPAYIVINAGESPTATPTTAAPTAEPTIESTPAPTPTPTTIIDDDGPVSTAPTCIALTLDQATGALPLTVTFTANGTDPDGTLTKATFNFGDGQVGDVTSGGGLGTETANVQTPHTYTTAGTYQASAILIDDAGVVSATTNCTQTITVIGDATATAAPTITPPGATEVLFGIGIASLILIIGGGLLFFIL